MPLLSGDAGAHRYDGGIYFEMADGDHILKVKVSDASLEDCERATRGRIDYMAIFNRHRYAIESVVRRKFKAKQREQDGSILITSADLNS